MRVSGLLPCTVLGWLRHRSQSGFYAGRVLGQVGADKLAPRIGIAGPAKVVSSKDKAGRNWLAPTTREQAMANEPADMSRLVQGGSWGQGQGNGLAAKQLTEEVQGRTSLLPARPPHRHQD